MTLVLPTSMPVPLGKLMVISTGASFTDLISSQAPMRAAISGSSQMIDRLFEGLTSASCNGSSDMGWFLWQILLGVQCRLLRLAIFQIPHQAGIETHGGEHGEYHHGGEGGGTGAGGDGGHRAQIHQC